ncbi:MAG: hypothetical protein COU10_03330 [Candidatus Harrisonbacteria bacterium CG10_big_fil_rev_8_21_14_0_10_45_28]|uniref:Glycosyltransferase 2-like domain-containing protein n=1 Tax=Candidatus Harrisonbacteria bacterium CG10_big_fil_rev_8_21_14_0_10_45_28 TaxID=1974586 RepID=A0A2H0UPS8_9BACT|nr:MAG: hypothetical protein COU10_03330 [Candidatus Harrisonbacteria bacterium CG10_big_fil_rev_8_21_14_0_10_45_28]
MLSDTKKLLSICIPAYNDRIGLRDLFESLADELADPVISKRVEIIVRDDASPDGSLETIMAGYLEKFSNVRFVRNDVNLGFDKNVLAVVSDAVGQYCWLMSDNDAIFPGSLVEIVRILEENQDVGHVYLQAVTFDKDLKKLQSKIKKDVGSIRFDSSEEFITVINLPGFISSQIVRKDLWDSIEKEKYIGNYWIHLSTILEFLPRTFGLYVTWPVIKARNKNAWAKDGKNMYVFLSLHTIINNLGEFGYSGECIKHFNRGFIRDLLEVAAYARIKGLRASFSLIGELVRKFYSHPFRLMAVLLVLITPRVILRHLGKIKTKLL